MKSRDFKQTAREALRGNWFVAVIAGFIASLLGGTSGTTGFSFNFTFEGQPNIGDEEVTAALPINFPVSTDLGYEAAWGFLIAFLLVFVVVGLIYSIIQLTIGSAVGVGYAQFNLDIIDSGDAKIGTMFSRFDQMKTAICANLLVVFRVLLGTVFFVIPGILMAYSYAMVNFVMAENPDMNAREALKESKRVMKGNRWKLFCLEFSFIGWAFLSIFTLGIALIWFTPYKQATLASFYREAKGKVDYSRW